VLSLDLHPVYGIPMYYSAETPGIMDVEVTVVVDSFAVFSKRQQ